MAPTKKPAKVKKALPKQTPQESTIGERSALPAFTLNLSFRNILSAILLLLGSALGSYASRLTLSPVYGDIPTSLHHHTICASIFAAVWGGKGIIRRFIRRPLWFLPILAFYVPAVQRHLFQYSDTWGAEYGPIYTEALSYYPTLFLAVLTSSYLLEMPSFVLDAIPGIASYSVFRVAEKFIPKILSHRIGTSWIFTRCGLTNIVAGSYSLLSPIALLLALPGIFHTAYYNPGCTEYAGTKYLNATLAGANLTVLARAESLTGYLSVMENNHARYRVLRCDHSLLGGDWLRPPPGFEHLSTGGKEPIYPVFVMLEAVRLVSPGPAAREPKALMIGLGVGTSHNGMMRHGIETHIVELDPMVYQYAKDYFGLQPNHTAYIMDAVDFVKNAVAAPELEQYDFIIHDVFTGGAAPSVLFTIDMMQGMRKILKDDGVVAINYAGDLKQQPVKTVIQTIRSVFGHCKLFREDEPLDGNKAVDFTNMVIFCTKSTQVFRFRPPLEEDYLNSLSRQQYLHPKFEVTLDTLFGSDDESEPVKHAVLDDETMQEFDQRQKLDAVHHWEIMRTVIDKVGWENY